MLSRKAAGKALLRLGVFGVPFLVYLAGLRYVGSGDTRPAELLPISVLEFHRLDFRELVPPGEPLPYWFHQVGPRVVSSYPILPGLLNVPTYAVARRLGVPLAEKSETLSLVTASAVSALSVLFLFQALCALGFARSSALWLSFAYAFGTCVWSVASRALWQHGPAVLFLSMALWFLCQRRESRVAWIGAFLALAVLSRPSTALLAIPLTAVIAVRWPRRLWSFLLGAGVPTAFHSWYCHVYLGTWFASGYWNAIPEIANFSGNPLRGLAGLLVSPSRGLLVFSPFLLFAVPGARRGLRSVEHRDLTVAMIVGITATLCLYCFWSVWWAGHSFGYRFLIELVPFLTILVGFWWESGASTFARASFGLLLAWSVYVQALGAFLQPSGFNQILDRDPGVLWSLRDSEIAISTRKWMERLR